MKYLLALAVVLVCGSTHALSALPSGYFEGSGTVWVTGSAPKPYTVSMRFKGNTYVEKWASDVRNGLLNVSITFQADGRFVMTIAESKFGSLQGYCGPSSCHVEGIATNGAKYEQTFWFEKDLIRKVGSETHPDKITMWESTLVRVP